MSSAETVIAGAPEGSIERPLLLYLFLNDLILFLHTTVLSNCKDDSNLYAISKDKEERKKILLENFQTAVKVSGITLDQKLSFNQHTKNISNRAGQNFSTLLRISPYYEDKQTKVI